MVSFGETYTAEVYFKGTSGKSKRRPVLIVDDTEDGVITFTEITSSKPKDPPGYYDGFKVEITDWQSAGLEEPSWAKCHKGNVHRAPKDRIIKRIGSVNNEVMTNVLTKIVNQ